MKMSDPKVQGMIAAIVQAANSGNLSGIRLELKSYEGFTDVHTSDSTMMRSHTDPSPMTAQEGQKLRDVARVEFHQQMVSVH